MLVGIRTRGHNTADTAVPPGVPHGGVKVSGRHA